MIIWPCHTTGQILKSAEDQNGIVTYFWKAVSPKPFNWLDSYTIYIYPYGQPKEVVHKFIILSKVMFNWIKKKKKDNFESLERQNQQERITLPGGVRTWSLRPYMSIAERLLCVCNRLKKYTDLNHSAQPTGRLNTHGGMNTPWVRVETLRQFLRLMKANYSV